MDAHPIFKGASGHKTQRRFLQTFNEAAMLGRMDGRLPSEIPGLPVVEWEFNF